MSRGLAINKGCSTRASSVNSPGDELAAVYDHEAI